MRSHCVAYGCPRAACRKDKPVFLNHLCIFVKNRSAVCAYGSISGPRILFHWSLCLSFFPISHWLDCCSFTGSLKLRLCAKSNFLLLNHFRHLTSCLEIILDLESCKNSTENPFTQAPLILTSYITTVKRSTLRISLWCTAFTNSRFL